MIRILNSKLYKIISYLHYGFGIGLCAAAFTIYADNPNYKGLQYGSKEDPYWLTVNGALKLDNRLFLGNKQGTDLHSGASIREFGLDFSAGISKDITVTLGTRYKARDSKVEVSDAYITYSGFKVGDNFHISIGKVNPSFCLENASSSKWIPFLERSLVSTAFQPEQGLGVSINQWSNNHSINVTLTQPKPDDTILDEGGNSIEKSDRFQLNARGTLAHFFDKNKFLQLGLSGHFKDNAHTGLEISTAPEANYRYSKKSLLNTTNPITKKLIKAKNHYVLGMELMGQDGPLSGEAEYQFTRVNRDKSPGEEGNLRFKGYRAHVNYVLTGESRIFKPANGTLGQVIPDVASRYGAWEISGRYSFLNLNNKNIIGGSGHNIGAAVTWYINYNVAVTGEYIKSKLYKRATLEKTNINTVAGRLQVVF